MRHNVYRRIYDDRRFQLRYSYDYRNFPGMDSEQPNIAEQVVNAFGGLTKLSKATGWPVSTIQNWPITGCIPGWRRDGIIAAAKRERVTLPKEFLKQEAA